MRKAALALVAAALTAALAGALLKPLRATAAPTQPLAAALAKKIDLYRELTRHWQQVMGIEPSALRMPAEHDPSLSSELNTLRLWRLRATAVERLAQNPPHKAEWLCIHRYEGSWTDRGGTYYGGLQMDLPFQRRYGSALLARKGTAERWTPLEQMWVAERALESGRGFYPWPNTARFCGLI